MVLSNEKKLLEGSTIEVSLKNQIETTLLAQIEKELTLFLRNDLKNDHILVSSQINAEAHETRPYTNAEIFNEMAKKNPALLKLRDELGLDTDY